MVTFETGSFTRLSNQVMRAVRFLGRRDVQAEFTAHQALGPELAFGRVVMAPTENWRYSSVSVGARKPELTAPHTVTRSVTW